MRSRNWTVLVLLVGGPATAGACREEVTTIGADGGAAGTGGRTAGIAGSEGAAGAGCAAELEEVRKAGDLDCPDTVCAAVAWAASCDSFASPPIARYTGVCDGPAVYFVEIRWADHSKICTYEYGSNGPARAGDRVLVGAAATADGPAFCDGTSSRISAGVDAAKDCLATDRPTSGQPSYQDYGVCPEAGGRGGEAGAGTSAEAGGRAGAGAGTPPVIDGDAGLCLNLFLTASGTGPPVCLPCCPDPLPECPAEGFPGYACTSMSNQYCECSCAGGQWSCPC